MRSKVTLRLMVAGFLLATSPSLVAADRVIDTDHSTLKIHVGKAGLFSAAGPHHWVTPPFDGGNINHGHPPPGAPTGAPPQPPLVPTPHSTLAHPTPPPPTAP